MCRKMCKVIYSDYMQNKNRRKNENGHQIKCETAVECQKKELWSQVQSKVN